MSNHPSRVDSRGDFSGGFNEIHPKIHPEGHQNPPHLSAIINVVGESEWITYKYPADNTGISRKFLEDIDMTGTQGLGFGVLPALRNFVVGRTKMAANNINKVVDSASTGQPGQVAADLSPFGPGGAERRQNRQALRPMKMMEGY